MFAARLLLSKLIKCLQHMCADQFVHSCVEAQICQIPDSVPQQAFQVEQEEAQEYTWACSGERAEVCAKTNQEEARCRSGKLPIILLLLLPHARGLE